MPELKTKPNDSNVETFLNSIQDEQRRKDAYILLDIMKSITKEKPRMWGTSIIGFGNVHYKYASGHEGDTCRIGFSPRKQNFSLYFTCYLDEKADILEKLGKYKKGKGCLYINKLSDVNNAILKKLIKSSV